MKVNKLAGTWIAAWLLTGSLIMAGLGWPALANALTPISQGYTTTDAVVLGSIVSLQTGSTDRVAAATPDNVNNLLGVVIDAGDSQLSLSTGQTNQVQVATSGVIQVLVSDINGPVSNGDSITASAISGVGMKATTNVKIVGITQGGLNNNNSSSETYTDKEGQKHTVRIGVVPLQLNVAYYFKQPDKTIVPAAVQNVADSIAGKSVRPVPIIVSMVIFIITLVVVASILYSMIRSSIISVGRNPMSQSAVYRDLIQLSGIVIIIMAVAIVAIYLVLTRL